jgi:hypothetical protein
VARQHHTTRGQQNKLEGNERNPRDPNRFLFVGRCIAASSSTQLALNEFGHKKIKIPGAQHKTSVREAMPNTGDFI